jgi:type II secretory pathway component GspD/PulD (secretin)
VLALAVLGMAAAAAADMRVYKPRHRLASELLPLAEVALAGEGSVAADAGTNSLVLMGPAGALARAVALLEQQDRALRNVVVHYESRRAADLESQGIRVAWQASAGAARVGNVIAPERDSFVAVAPEAAVDRGQGGTQGVLRILEGQTGRIAAGVEVPVTTRSIDRRGLRETTSFVTAASGFEVTPRPLADGRVHLEFAPFEERIAGSTHAGPVVQRSGAASSITVAPGETVALGGLAREASAQGDDAFSGRSDRHTRDEQLLLVRVELE